MLNFDLNVPDPRNAQEALAQAIRHDRAQRILDEGYTFEHDADLNCIYVCKPGALSFSYIIHGDAENLTGKAGCDCPDMQKTGKACKHYLAARILQDEQRLVARYEDMIGNGYTG
jgi:SWIM zinc finger